MCMYVCVFMQVAVDGTLEDVTELCTGIVMQIRDVVKARLSSAGVEIESITGLSEIFAEDSEFCQPFHNLDTYYRQLAFYRAHFSLVVSLYLM